MNQGREPLSKSVENVASRLKYMQNNAKYIKIAYKLWRQLIIS